MVQQTFARRVGLLVVLALIGTSAAAGTWNDINYGGKLRVYDYHRDLEAPTLDQDAFSAGGSFILDKKFAEHYTVGLGLYVANSLGTKNDNLARQYILLPAKDIAILGEAYARAVFGDHKFDVGRVVLNTPFANASDAMMIPISFLAAQFTTVLPQNVNFTLGVIDEIKTRESSEFVDVGEFITTRFLGAASAKKTGSDGYLGLKYSADNFTASLWDYYFSDILNLTYLDGAYTVSHSDSLTSTFSVQVGNESDVGDKLLSATGKVKSSLYGAQYALARGKTKLALSYNSVAKDATAYKAGGFLAPFSYFTDPVYTDSMVSGLPNILSGTAYKIALENTDIQDLLIKVSYAQYYYSTAASSRGETDVWFKYSPASIKGFSAWLRTGFVNANLAANEMAEYRVMLEYVF